MKKKGIKNLTYKQTRDILQICENFVTNNNLSPFDADKYFDNGTDTLAHFFINYIENLNWFDYALYAKSVLLEIQMYVMFLYDKEEWLNKQC